MRLRRSGHTRREVAEEIPVDKIVVWQQDDGLWRWRWFPAEADGEPLLVSYGFESAEEAEESARSAYPQTTRIAVEGPNRSLVAETTHATRTGCGALLATVAVAGLVMLRRRALEHKGAIG